MREADRNHISSKKKSAKKQCEPQCTLEVWELEVSHNYNKNTPQVVGWKVIIAAKIGPETCSGCEES